jgi:hypothetical protein
MSLYRKRPVVVKAARWFENGDHPDDFQRDIHDPVACIVWTAKYRRQHNWEGDVVRYYRDGKGGDRCCEQCGNPMHVHGFIDTLEGGHIVCPGDWVITGVSGEYYPCKPWIFESTYDLVEPEGILDGLPYPCPCQSCTERRRDVDAKSLSLSVEAREILAKGHDTRTSPTFIVDTNYMWLGKRCPSCSTTLVTVRGRYPGEEDRLICPSCTVEELDTLKDSIGASVGRTGANTPNAA